MRGVRTAAAVVALAVVLLVAGGIGVLRSPDPPVRGAEPALPEAGALLRPGLGAGSLEASIETLQERLRAIPGDASAYAQLGVAYVAQARVSGDPSWYPKAEGVLRRSIRLEPRDNAEALLGLGALDLARHDFAEALASGREAEALNPYDADVYGVIGDALLELGRYDRAFDVFQTMIDRRPSLASYARASYARELLGDREGAIGAMRAAYDAAGSPADAAWAAHQLGELEWNRGEVGAAARWYRRGLDLDPSFVPNEAGLARAAWARGNTTRAIDAYQDVVARYPSIEFVAALGDLYTISGRDDLAAEQYAVVDAARRLQRSNGVNVDLEAALFDAEHGDPGRAVEAAMAEWGRRHSVHVADALAWALFMDGQQERALRFSERALALGTRSPTFLFHAGMIERALGHDAEALRLLHEALELNPHFSILHAETAARAVEDLEAER